MNNKNRANIEQYFEKVRSSIALIESTQVEAAATLLLEAYDSGRSIFIFGNGGSAANASHFCGDMLKGASFGRKKGFRFFCLADNTTAVMAIANDLSYEDIFVAQLQYLIRPGDLVMGISGSGNSPNVLKALQYAKENGGRTIGLCGFDGGKLKAIVDTCIHVPVKDMEVTEDAHMAVLHCLKRTIMQELDVREGKTRGASC